MQQLVICIGNQLLHNIFRASLRPSSGGQTAFTAYGFLSCCSCCDVESQLAICVHSTQFTQVTSRLSNITTAIAGQKTIGSKRNLTS
jgi:hypothetical protein